MNIVFIIIVVVVLNMSLYFNYCGTYSVTKIKYITISSFLDFTLQRSALVDICFSSCVLYMKATCK